MDNLYSCSMLLTGNNLIRHFEAASGMKVASSLSMRKTNQAGSKKTPVKSVGASTSDGRKKPIEKDPKGGLTAAGRKAFAENEGSHLRPGVKGPADTPEKMKRKGSFLTRHFTHPQGPMVKDARSTRLALSAHAWGERIPKTEAAAARLGAKGRKLLEKYHRIKDGSPAIGRVEKDDGAGKENRSAKTKSVRKSNV